MADHTQQQRRVFTVTEVAEALGTNRETVLRMCVDGTLRGAFKLGSASNHHWRIPRNAHPLLSTMG